jgi:hypothetical protein
MTIFTLVLYIAIAAGIITAVMKFAWPRKITAVWLSFLQNFCAALFLFSGFVKAVDPLGTAFKMEQYFAEFESTFSGAGMNSFASIFPAMSQYAISFSVLMIVFEMVLGLMMLIGAYRGLAAWLFLSLVAFFTVLTGFTYLTGYVPAGVNFFEFSKWEAFVETNMKVTDCGCFGDFLKLKPKTSFLKDVFLLVPSIIFVIAHRKMHQLFSAQIRSLSIGVFTSLLLVYNLNNFLWNEPHLDFRPFKVGVNVAKQKALETEANNNVEISAYKLTKKSDKQVVNIPYDQFLKEYQNYPSTEWEFDQVKSDPFVWDTIQKGGKTEVVKRVLLPSKISDFYIMDADDSDVTDQILYDEGYNFLIVGYKLYNETKYLDQWNQTVGKLAKAAMEDGVTVRAVVAYTDAETLSAFGEVAGIDYPLYKADDIMLKTIIRSNPGVLLLRNGQILMKWHIRKLPAYETIKSTYFVQ